MSLLGRYPEDGISQTESLVHPYSLLLYSQELGNRIHLDDCDLQNAQRKYGIILVSFLLLWQGQWLKATRGGNGYLAYTILSQSPIEGNQTGQEPGPGRNRSRYYGRVLLTGLVSWLAQLAAQGQLPRGSFILSGLGPPTSTNHKNAPTDLPTDQSGEDVLLN